MTDGESACFFLFCFQNLILDILLFASTLANAEQNEGETQLMFSLLSFTADDCNLCLEDDFGLVISYDLLVTIIKPKLFKTKANQIETHNEAICIYQQ